MAEDETGASGEGIEVFKGCPINRLFPGNREGLIAQNRPERVDHPLLVDFDVEEKTLIEQFPRRRGHFRRSLPEGWRGRR